MIWTVKLEGKRMARRKSGETFNFQRSTLNVQRRRDRGSGETFNFQRSTFNVQRRDEPRMGAGGETFNFQRSTFPRFPRSPSVSIRGSALTASA